MNTHVKIELAKVLKAKEFDGYCEDWAFLDENCMAMQYDKDTCVKVPKIVDVVMWLYEKHNIWIYSTPPSFKTWYYNIESLNNSFHKEIRSGFNSPTEAYEKAIEYALNLIEPLNQK